MDEAKSLCDRDEKCTSFIIFSSHPESDGIFHIANQTRYLLLFIFLYFWDSMRFFFSSLLPLFFHTCLSSCSRESYMFSLVTYCDHELSGNMSVLKIQNLCWPLSQYHICNEWKNKIIFRQKHLHLFHVNKSASISCK